ncbi:hypothetical protein GCM10027031_02000 [Corynebacterium atrinae]
MDINGNGEAFGQITRIAGVIDVSVGEHDGLEVHPMLLEQINDPVMGVHARVNDHGGRLVRKEVSIGLVGTTGESEKLHAPGF